MNRFVRFFATAPDRPTRHDAQEIDHLYRRTRASVMVGITLGYGLSYLCRLGISVVKKPLIDTGIVTAEQLGVIGAAFFYTYAVSRFTNGFLADHANIKRFFPAGLLLSALVNLAVGGNTAFWLFVLLWGLNGWFQGFGSVSSVVALNHWFAGDERGRFYGIWSTAHALGEGLTFVATAAVAAALGWRFGFIGPGLVCVAVAVGLYLALADRPQTLGLPSVAQWRQSGKVAGSASTLSRDRFKDQLRVLRMPALWVLGLACMTMSATRYAMNSWGVLYLQEAKHYTLLKAGSMLAINTVAGIAGCVAYGFVSDTLFKARRPPANLLFGLIEVGALAAIFLCPADRPLWLSAAFALYGFGLSGILAALGGLFAIDLAPRQAAGAAMGFIGVFSYLGAAFQELVSGLLIHRATVVVNGVRHYDFHYPTLFWLGTSVVSLLLAASLWRAGGPEKTGAP
jgi:OPA family sugar phosphate sensor protein UhpC-like MFS transporter